MKQTRGLETIRLGCETTYRRAGRTRTTSLTGQTTRTLKQADRTIWEDSHRFEELYMDPIQNHSPWLQQYRSLHEHRALPAIRDRHNQQRNNTTALHMCWQTLWIMISAYMREMDNLTLGPAGPESPLAPSRPEKPWERRQGAKHCITTNTNIYIYTIFFPSSITHKIKKYVAKNM